MSLGSGGSEGCLNRSSSLISWLQSSGTHFWFHCCCANCSSRSKHFASRLASLASFRFAFFASFRFSCSFGFVCCFSSCFVRASFRLDCAIFFVPFSSFCCLASRRFACFASFRSVYSRCFLCFDVSASIFGSGSGRITLLLFFLCLIRSFFASRRSFMALAMIFLFRFS